MFPPEALSGPPGAENGLDDAAVAFREVLAAAAPELHMPKIGWRRVVDADSAVVFLAHVPGDPPWKVVVLRQSGGVWARDVYGDCPLSVALPAGIGLAEWRLAGGDALTPETTVVRLMITELACAGGKSPEGRVLDPVIVYGADSVVVTFAVQSLPGSNDCVGNPQFPVTIRLSEPLGNRELLDGSTVPPSHRN